MYAWLNDDPMMISTDGRMNSDEFECERERRRERIFDKRENKRGHVRIKKNKIGGIWLNEP